VLSQVLQRFSQADIRVVDVGLRRPTLDDVFLTLTGHVAEGVDEESDERSDRSEDHDLADAKKKEVVR